MKRHLLKTHPQFFEAVLRGDKTFELRRNDRDFQSNEMVLLREYDPSDGTYSGRERLFDVGYVLRDDWLQVPTGHCIFSLLPSRFWFWSDERALSIYDAHFPTEGEVVIVQRGDRLVKARFQIEVAAFPEDVDKPSFTDITDEQELYPWGPWITLTDWDQFEEAQ